MRPETELPDPGWYVLRVHPKREDAVRVQLHRRGLLALAPHEVYWVKPSRHQKRENPGRRWIPKERPLFTRLVFARAEGGADWTAIRQTPFVQGVLSMAGRYYRLSDKDVTMLYNVDGIQVAEPADPKVIRAGQKAKVSVGAFAGHPCEVQSIAGRRAKVLVMLFGSMTVAELPLTSLEAA